jgi:hypothetical protein
MHWLCSCNCVVLVFWKIVSLLQIAYLMHSLLINLLFMNKSFYPTLLVRFAFNNFIYYSDKKL